MCFSRKKKAIKTNSTPIQEDTRNNHQTGRNLVGGNTSMNPSREWRGLNKKD